MQALVCISPGNFEYKTVPDPVCTKGHAIVKINRIGVCGTDLHAFEGTQPYFEYPRILGHELAASFIEGDAEGFETGEPVTIIPYLNCGACIACRNGKPNCCVNIKVCGVHCDGGMTTFYAVPSYTLLHADGLNDDALALTEPLAIGAHAVGRAAIQPGEYVLVIGAGPIGLGVMEFARIAGGTVIAMDISEKRMAFCKAHPAISYCINPATENAMEKIAEITTGDMPAVVLDATGNLRAINEGFQYMAHGGRFVLVGLQKENISFSHPAFHKREATLMSSRNATRKDFSYVMDCIKNGLVNPTPYITHRVAFKEVKKEFPGWLNPGSGVIKAMIEL